MVVLSGLIRLVVKVCDSSLSLTYMLTRIATIEHASSSASGTPALPESYRIVSSCVEIPDIRCIRAML